MAVDWWTHVVAATSPADGSVSLNPAPLSIDGVTLANGNRVLLTQQSTLSQNTTYTWTAGTPNTLVATTDVPAPRAAVQVGPGGTYNANTAWALNDTTNYQWTRQIPRVNVRDFGAKGDGTNDYAAITTAMTSLPASGGTLLFPAGKSFSSPLTYAVTSNALSIPANVQVEFEEGAILAPGNQKTVTIQGRIKAHPTQQIFGGTGTLSASTATRVQGGGTGTISLSGSPVGSYSFAVQIITGGSSPTFQYSLNYSSSGGTVWSTTQSFTSSYNIPNTGLTITFSGSFAGLSPGPNDILTWSSGCRGQPKSASFWR